MQQCTSLCSAAGLSCSNAHDLLYNRVTLLYWWMDEKQCASLCCTTEGRRSSVSHFAVLLG